MESVWAFVGVAAQDSATRRFLWRGIRGQKVRGVYVR